MKFAAAACGLLAFQVQGHQQKQQSQFLAALGVEAPDYAAQCREVMKQCEQDEQAATDDYDRNLKALEEEYLRQKRILANKEDVHSDETAEMKEQKAVVAEEKMDVEKARKVVKENAHCPPELEEAERELSKQVSIPNDSEERIDDECQAKKVVLEKRACVEELRRAQRVLAEEKGEHSQEKGELRGEVADVNAAAAALPPQERRVADALAAWEAAKKRGPPTSDDSRQGCYADRDRLLWENDQLIRDLEAEYLRQKRILENKEEVHSDEKADVADQKDVVAEEKRHVQKAKVIVKENAHCPPKLEEAKDELAKQEAIPNETPEDVHAECLATKEVLKWQKCVDELRDAEIRLAREEDEHSDEKDSLVGEKGEASDAKAALPPQEQRVADALAALEAARRARDALAECGKEQKPAPTTTESPPPKPDDSAAATASVGATVVAAMAAAAVCSL
eukprot:TRINITY_DN82070_c0_g1_i1.p1 TRINITY_DN82070_c0_g1~~TRINITY_DN82070_c0_g1_i1.p1  ORF type:complete len:452 (+),score=192.17 TRINITY_DN82070_c0_g1_i1:65-1420(+)